MDIPLLLNFNLTTVQLLSKFLAINLSTPLGFQAEFLK